MSFRIDLVTPEQTLLSGDADFVLARGISGDVGILAGHAPMLVGLAIGRLEVRRPGGGAEIAAVHGGFMEVAPDKVTILADQAELVRDIDAERARLALEDARAQLADRETEITKARLKRAELRLELAGEA